MALFKNKETDKKRKGENVIGKIIYGFLLFAPLMSILFTSLYTIFNKNAYESYYGETINNYQYENLTNKELVIDEQYTFINYSNSNTNIQTSTIYVNNVENVYADNEGLRVIIQNLIALRIYYDDALKGAFIHNNNGTTTTNYYYLNNYNFQFDFTLVNYENNVEDILPYFNIKVYNNYSFLDNAFEYGIYKTEQSNIYNWSKTTGTYTVLQNVCTGIGITNTFVPMLMAYWLLISIIYFLFDIALILIWAVHNKIHALKDAI